MSWRASGRSTGPRGRYAAAAAALVAAVAAAPSPGAGQGAAPAVDRPLPPAARTAEVVRAVEALDAMRSSLARTFSEGGAEADRETFRAVCRPVGERARRIAEENGWRLQQLSRRYRNPAHAPDAEAAEVLRRMAADPGLGAMWRATRLEGRPGWRYFRRIAVEPACLACHGAKGERPAFVRRGYPEDRAHGFAPGDLRGAYVVFVPVDSARRAPPTPRR